MINSNLNKKFNSFKTSSNSNFTKSFVPKNGKGNGKGNANVNFNGLNIGHIISIILSIVLFILIVMLVYYYVADCYSKKSLGDYLIDFSFDPCADKSSPTPTYTERKALDEEEVYHVANQDYTYEEAKCKCKAYNGRLATKAQIIDSYNKGADWCSYGWSEGQTGYYPTQKCHWDKLQRGPKKNRDDCGMPGVNGGFFSNPLLRFGTNCYGVKPKGEVAKEKKAKCRDRHFCKDDAPYSSTHKLGTDNISSFNRNLWSQYD